ncbi:SMP-30/gluconolactonase/LRE family protein [Pelagibacteraceae bacterium]|nr:SMP-30/gluconolactonase/LRE family protein [Pelagibacteraceae bacterium]
MNKNLLPADQDPRNPSFNYKNSQNENVNNSDKFNDFLNNNEVKQIFTGCLWAEGPAYIPHLDTLVWSDIPNNRMLKIKDNNVSEYKNPSNFCNGNTIDNHENLISCSHGGRCLYRTDDNMNTEILIDNYQGKKLNSPNDICVHSNGDLFFTDPPYGILSDYEGYIGKQEYGGCYVFSFNEKTKKLNVIINDLVRPNGITLSPNEDKLYVADTGENIKHLYSYDLINGVTLNRKLIYDFKPFFSDGFRCDKDGNIWTSAGKAIKCFNPKFELIGQIKIPELVSNCEFGGKEGNILYITATTSLYSIELNQQGAKFGK